jgi:hypothetical protein
MTRRLPILTILLLILSLTNSYGQDMVITTVDLGPYTPGSSIAALFTIPAATNTRPDNEFRLYLSDAAGSFASERLIGTFKGLYSTFVNGLIPPETAAGTGYKVRIKSTNPGTTGSESAAFEIRAGASVTAKLVNTRLLNPSSPEIFGYCSGRANVNFNLENQSTTDATVSARVTNELNGGPAQDINFNISAKTFIAQQAFDCLWYCG